MTTQPLTPTECVMCERVIELYLSMSQFVTLPINRGPQTTFIEMIGEDSLDFVEALLMVEAEYGVELPTTRELVTVLDMVRAIQQAQQKKVTQ